MKKFGRYFEKINHLLKTVDEDKLRDAVDTIQSTADAGGKLIFIGNGGSAAMSSHLSVDFTKACGIRSINFNEADLITCFANDYGYENWCEQALSAYADQDDLVILISSSGNSQNILNAAKYCLKNNICFITFTGFSVKNSLNGLGLLNFHVNSNCYNFVEMVHHIWLVSLVDYIAEVDEFEK